MSNPLWKLFEQAVAAFLSALDPTARVKHDVSIPDLDTGTPRQRDVWIEAKVMGHFPITLYVSCKDTDRPISQQGLDAIIGELRSSGADIGVVYATGGFTTNALSKAKKVGIHCCQLFIDQPPTLPDHLVFPAYLCVPEPMFILDGDVEDVLGVTTYEELFAYDHNSPDGLSLLAHLDEMFLKTIQETDEESLRVGKLPPSGATARMITLGSSDTGKKVIFYTAFEFEFYEGKLDSYLLNGSYCFSSGEFIGSQFLPRISLGDDYPGPFWTPVDRSLIEGRKTFGCVMMYPHKYTDRLLDTLKGPIPKQSSAPSV